MEIKCKIYKRKPEEIGEYTCAAKRENMIPEEYVKTEEGTYNPRTGLFYCTECYIRIGMPLGLA